LFGVVFRVTLDNGRKYLIHKGPNYGGSGGNTVVTNAKHMSNKWSASGSKAAKTGTTVGDLVKAGGSGYKLTSDNCYHGAKQMENKAGKR